MMIECVLDRAEPVKVSISNETYEFLPDAKGRKVAEVWIPSHIKSFLAVSHLYREATDEPAFDPVATAKAAARANEAEATETGVPKRKKAV